MSADDMTGDTRGLSAAGENRRTVILAAVREASKSRRLRRRIGLFTAAAAPVLAVAAVGWSLLPGTSAQLARPIAGAGSESAVPRVVLVATDASVVARYAIEPGPIDSLLLDDDELLGMLEEAGHAAGMVRTRGKVMVTGLPTAADESGAGSPTGLLESGPGAPTAG